MSPHARKHDGVGREKQMSKSYPSLVLVKPRMNRPYITERLLMGRKESNQTNKQTNEQNSLAKSRFSHNMGICCISIFWQNKYIYSQSAKKKKLAQINL